MASKAIPQGLLLFALFHSSVQATFWTVTENYQMEPGTTTYDEGDSFPFTTTRTMLSGVTPTVEAVSSTTYTYDWEDVELVQVYYSQGAVKESQLEPPYTGFVTKTTIDASTYFIMPVTYTAPATCTSDFTFATSVAVYIPTEVLPLITPTSVVTDKPYTYSTYSLPGDVTWFLSPNAAPWSSISGYDYSWYIASCSTPPTYPTYTRHNYGSSGDSSNDEDDDYDLDYCLSRYGCHSLKFWIILLASIIPTLFILGFLESYFWFRRLMTGRSALRFGTICWICISLWVTCFTRKQAARSSEDQKMLAEQWKGVSKGTAFKLWLKWGFRHGYPTQVLAQYSSTTVGTAPPNYEVASQGAAGQPMVQQYGQVAMPPAAYVNQQAVSAGATPVAAMSSASDQGKDGATIAVQPITGPDNRQP